MHLAMASFLLLPESQASTLVAQVVRHLWELAGVSVVPRLVERSCSQV